MSARVALQFTPVPLATLCLALRAVEAETGVYQGNLLATRRSAARFTVARHRLWRLLGQQGYGARAISEVCCATGRQVRRILGGSSSAYRSAAAVLARRAQLDALPEGTSLSEAARAVGGTLSMVKRWREQRRKARPSSAARMQEGMFRAAPLRTHRQTAA